MKAEDFKKIIEDYTELRKLYVKLFEDMTSPFYKSSELGTLIKECDRKIFNAEETLYLKEYDE